jgi:hypothetical protein
LINLQACPVLISIQISFTMNPFFLCVIMEILFCLQVNFYSNINIFCVFSFFSNIYGFYSCPIVTYSMQTLGNGQLKTWLCTSKFSSMACVFRVGSQVCRGGRCGRVS